MARNSLLINLIQNSRVGSDLFTILMFLLLNSFYISGQCPLTTPPEPDIMSQSACEGVSGNDRPQVTVQLPGSSDDYEAVWIINNNPAGITPGTEFAPGDHISGLVSFPEGDRRTARLEGTAPTGVYELCVYIIDRSDATCFSPVLCGFELTLFDQIEVTIMADPDGDICEGMSVLYSADITNPVTSMFTYAWCAYENNMGIDPCEDIFDDNTAQSPTGTWNLGIGPGSIGVTVTGNIPGCVTSYFTGFNVLPLPEIECPADPVPICSNETLDLSSIDFNPMPAGGDFVFTGDGVSGTTFDPSGLALGNHTITVEYTDLNGCATECHFDIDILGIPDNSFRDEGLLTSEDHMACPGEIFEYGAEVDPTDGFIVQWSISGGGVIQGDDDEREVEIQWENSGVHTVTLTVTDNSTGCTNSSSLEVTVLSPVIICPDDIMITMVPLACDTMVMYADPTDGSTCNIMDPIFNRISGPSSGDVLPAGTHEVMYELVDDYNNRDTCSFYIIINEFQPDYLLCMDYNISLGETCGAEELTPALLLKGDQYGCLDSCTLLVTDKHGNIHSNTFNVDDIGITYHYLIMCGTLPCSGKITIEDKIRPQIVCLDDTISCTQVNDYPIVPNVMDNCGATVVLIGEIVETFQCNSELTGRLIRTWLATDAGGNKDTCIQYVGLRRSDLNAIEWPDNFTEANGNPLICGTGFALDDDGHPHPSVTGSPKLDGMDLYPDLMGAICNGFIRYRDTVVINTDCKKRIRRHWEVGEWWCSELVKSEWLQMIEIIDTLPPMLSSLPFNMTLTTGIHDCYATVVLPPIGFIDLCVTEVKVNIDYPFGFLQNSNGGIIKLPEGVHTITYEVIDKCKQAAYHEIIITVMDMSPPTPICRQNLVVGLNHLGSASLLANALNNGSFDACTEEVTFLAKRLDDGCSDEEEEWAEWIYFCCADAGKSIMVALLVTDGNGNTNICMVNVEVQDKLEPKMECLPDATVDCRENFGLNNLAFHFGFPEITDNCPDNNDIIERVLTDFNQCGIGVITRIFDLVNASGMVVQTCEQNIFFEVNDTLSYEDIIWPKDSLFENICEYHMDLLPENLPEGYGYPVVPDTFCNLSAFNYWEEIFDATEGEEACFKIVRTWRVIDWCTQVENGTGLEFLSFEYQQYIKVINTIEPEITDGCEDVVVANTSPVCGKIEINLSIEAMDDCTPEELLVYLYSIDMDDDGIINVSGTGKVATDSFAVGIHRIYWEVLDRCGNIALCDYLVEVVHGKPPTPIAFDSLSVPLIPMAFGGGPGDDTAMVTISADIFDNKSFHPCGFDLSFSFSNDVDDTTMTFGCEDIGIQSIQFWVTDENGTQAFVNVGIIILPDSLGICPVNSPRVGISGKLYTEENQFVEKAEVFLIGSELPSFSTDLQGTYDFGFMDKGGKYIVKAAKDDDVLNGVSTLDLVMIQRHILGVQPIRSPYKQIAADINSDGRISVADIMELRRVILGHRDYFSNSQSWKFADASFDVTDPNIWIEDIPLEYNIDLLDRDMEVDFIGIKVGDINGDARPNQRMNLDPYRSGKTAYIHAADRLVEFGEEIHITMAVYEKNLLGMQWSLSGKDVRWTGLEKGSFDIDMQNYMLQEDIIRFSYNWDNHEPGGFDEPIYLTLRGVALSDGVLSEMIFFDESFMKAELYKGGGTPEAIRLSLDWKKENIDPFQVYQNFPNPWRDQTVIRFDVPRPGRVQFIVRDISGRELMNFTEYYPQGTHQREVSNHEISSGRVLIYEMKYEDVSISKRMIKIE
ncbi:MAG TPA: HYR domain-containing protein [Saprospiraceae bacterium]|nr:HYR domain-containing protein [Saprospiraceae bacterium]